MTYAVLGIAATSGSNMALTRRAFARLDGFRPDLLCNTVAFGPVLSAH